MPIWPFDEMAEKALEAMMFGIFLGIVVIAIFLTGLWLFFSGRSPLLGLLFMAGAGLYAFINWG